MWKFLDQGSNPCHSCGLCHSCGNARSLMVSLLRWTKVLNLMKSGLCGAFVVVALTVDVTPENPLPNPRFWRTTCFFQELCLGLSSVLNKFCFFLCFLGPHLQHMEVPRLRGESELQLLAYDTATATQDLSHICNLHRSSWQCQISNPLSKARDQTCILMDTSQIRFCWATMGTPGICIFKSPSWPLDLLVHSQS